MCVIWKCGRWADSFTVSFARRTGISSNAIYVILSWTSCSVLETPENANYCRATAFTGVRRLSDHSVQHIGCLWLDSMKSTCVWLETNTLLDPHRCEKISSKWERKKIWSITCARTEPVKARTIRGQQSQAQPAAVDTASSLPCQGGEEGGDENGGNRSLNVNKMD